MSFLRNSQICHQNFDMSDNNNYNNNNEFNNIFNNLKFNRKNKYNIKSSINLVDNILDSLDKELSQSVLDLTKCFICLGPTENPLSCPKCNNFACTSCLINYFGGLSVKKCPLCKQDIYFSDMNRNEIVSEIDRILNKNESKENKIEELSNLIEKKKNLWERHGEDLNTIIEKLFKYQDLLGEYKNRFESFFSECKLAVEKAFEDYNKKVEELINSLLAINRDVKNTLIRCNSLNRNSIINFYNNNKIKNLINEILDMDRKHFNNKGKDETEALLNTPIKVNVSMYEYHLYRVLFKKHDFNRDNISFRNKHYRVGEFEIKYTPINYDGYKASSEFIIYFKDNMNACFNVTQNLTNRNNEITKVFPMRFKSKNGKTYVYEGMIYFDCFDNGTSNEVGINISVLTFFVK